MANAASTSPAFLEIERLLVEPRDLPLAMAGASRHADWLSLFSITSKGTPGASFAPRMTSDVRTLRDMGAAVKDPVRKLWKVERSGATHFMDEVDLTVEH